MIGSQLGLLPAVAEPDRTERRALQFFERRGAMLARRIGLGDVGIESEVEGLTCSVDEAEEDLVGDWWGAYLGGQLPRAQEEGGARLRVADLFCGAGGLSLGVRQAAAELGMTTVTELAVDSDAAALATFAANHEVRERRRDSVTALVDYRVNGWEREASFSYLPEIIDEGAAAACERVDLLAAGPPCQGHSNLNNRSRRSDLRNHLMLAVPAFAVAAGVSCVVIENVPEVVHDYKDVAKTTISLLERAGYGVTQGVLRADAMGWPQTRRRYFIIACRDREPVSLADIGAALSVDWPRSVGWLLDWLEAQDAPFDELLDRGTAHNEENQGRIDWLFDNDAYDLPDRERPASHRGGHTYGAVYGRMRPDSPAPTITTGFTTPGRGRFIHPTERRTLTPREASLVQGFPLGYRFVGENGARPSRSQLAKWIGDAVPMPLGYAAALSALAGMRDGDSSA